MGLPQFMSRLLGRSTYKAATPAMGPELDSPQVEALREAMGGQLAPLPYTQTRWLLRDLEAAQIQADSGYLFTAAKLWNASKRDGVFAGVLSTRTGGLVRLRKQFRGDPEQVEALEWGHDSVRSVFDEMCPPSELALMADDGIGLGVGVGELLPVEGRSYPVLVRLPPENLFYMWSQDRWYYRSIAGLLPITPGDGRWVLHLPGGRIAPWQSGIWRAVGRAFINKEHALLMNSNWEAKLANPARVGVAPEAATEAQSDSWFRKIAAWGINTVFLSKPGYDVKLLESNGRGSDSFDRTVKRSEREFVVSVAGQEVTTDGGAGFQNSDIHKSIRADLIKATADGLAYTVNTQVLPPWVVNHYGIDALERSACVEWDVTPPKDRGADAQAWQAAANAMKMLFETMALAASQGGENIRIDLAELLRRQAIPVLGDKDGDGKPDVVVEGTAILPTVGGAGKEATVSDIASAIELAKQSGLRPTEESIRAILGRMGLTLESLPKTSAPAVKLDLAPTDIAKVIRVDEARASRGLAPIGDERGTLTIPELTESAKDDDPAATTEA